MDPERHIAWRFREHSLIRTDFHWLELPGRENLPFDSAAIFDRLRREVARCEGRNE
jgi:hypothetical protein